MNSILVSLTPGFSRVWAVSQPVKTVLTVFHIVSETVKTVACPTCHASTPLKQGANEMEWRTRFGVSKGAN
jgi:4-hydroxy-3-methylbut-2-en-1-yl diphosphate synthase IspG/GcpE